MKLEDMSLNQIIERMNAIKAELDTEGADVAALTDEADKLIERKKELEEESAMIERRKALSAKLAAGMTIDPIPEPQSDEMIERKAFMDYVTTGTVSGSIKRAGTAGTGADLGILIPNHVQQEIIKEIEGTYGTLYNSVKHLNLPGGVQYPVGSFDATFKRITEDTVSDRQKAGSITGSVTFGYKIGEIRLARTLLQQVLSVPAFEAEFAKVVAKAFLKAIDLEILNGKEASNECEGITTNANVKTITLSAADMADWKAIQKKVFAKFPLGFKNKSYEFVMSNGTWEGNFKTLADENGRAVYTEGYALTSDMPTLRLKGKPVSLVEKDLLGDFDDASTGDVFAIAWVPSEAYAINSNMQFSTVKYFDHETNQEVTKALVINDGKVLRPDLIYLIKKG